MKREVIFIDETINVAGAEINLLNMIGLLPAEGWTPLVVLPGRGQLSERLAAAGVAVHFVPHPPFVTTTLTIKHKYWLPNPLGLLLSLFAGLVWTFRLARFLRGHPCGVVHTISTWSHACGGMAARLARLPAVWHFQEIVHPQAGWGLYRQMVMAAARILPKRILCISARVAEPFQAQQKVRSKVVLLWNTIDIARFTPRAAERVGREEIERAALNIATVARLTPWKGQAVALDAARRLKELAVPFRWRFVGDESLGVPGYRQQLVDLIAKYDLLEQVQMVGWVEDMPALYQEEDILVHIPTEPEPFGLVLAEALSAGMPVITTNHGGAAALVAEAGGILVPPGEAQPVAEALLHWWQAPEERLRTGCEARRFAEKTFGFERYVAQLVGVYETLLEENDDCER